jgi:hypothetical protein
MGSAKDVIVAGDDDEQRQRFEKTALRVPL